MSDTPTDLELPAEGRKPKTPSAGTAHVAVVGLEYIPTGAKQPKRFAAGAHLEKCPQALLDEYLERGDVVPEADYGDPEVCARAEANTPPPAAVEDDADESDDEGSEPA